MVDQFVFGATNSHSVASSSSNRLSDNRIPKIRLEHIPEIFLINHIPRTRQRKPTTSTKKIVNKRLVIAQFDQLRRLSYNLQCLSHTRQAVCRLKRMLRKEYSVSPEMRRSLLQRPRNLSLCISKTPLFIFLWV
ncbi:hypothetical protein J4E90_010997 [Alternaria incomplexa]|uniref:uncharacterized protein n=1 Tax=Alternaria incomplexa TaxID=1187928 RepID=UPI00221F7AFE|nr:uncharacterized protein J4E90_010997 [Alternaria incomplexa]KAI4905999.1 hypothetical protein J4E90_010997 [Alternaria incomplexa]